MCIHQHNYTNVQFLTFTFMYYTNYPNTAYVKILPINKCLVQNYAGNYVMWFTSQLLLHLQSRQRFVSVTKTLRKPGLHCGHLGEGHMAKEMNSIGEYSIRLP